MGDMNEWGQWKLFLWANQETVLTHLNGGREAYPDLQNKDITQWMAPDKNSKRRTETEAIFLAITEFYKYQHC